ncbi:hypothetical protein AC622_00350 [Bacillus sp. FJAT-27916]|uniref:molybdenum cofactor guanylyltransferase n=1 Tax=Bacillus sp. FJAT-27916 TaxID=1679169 RepID=UPI00069DD3F5|nr:molybdenum cofactor guanylyltransferase [Bacillus sp. FJAT-27916]KMY42902.1 hypothetical protein AC622_00350 [Bacillus sp. FJAT-27916]
MNRTIILLAGGQSSRMGTNKALLPIEGETVISRIAKEAGRIGGELLLVTNEPEVYEFLHLPHVRDLRAGMGPLAGLEAGLTASATEHNLLIACDLPFFKAGTGERLLRYLDQYELAVPRTKGRLHPLCAAYHKSLLPHVQYALDAGQRRMDSLLDAARAKIVEEENPRCFFNMNTMQDYEWMKRIHKGEGHEISAD